MFVLYSHERPFLGPGFFLLISILEYLLYFLYFTKVRRIENPIPSPLLHKTNRPLPKQEPCGLKHMALM